MLTARLQLWEVALRGKAQGLRPDVQGCGIAMSITDISRDFNS